MNAVNQKIKDKAAGIMNCTLAGIGLSVKSILHYFYGVTRAPKGVIFAPERVFIIHPCP